MWPSTQLRRELLVLGHFKTSAMNLYHYLQKFTKRGHLSRVPSDFSRMNPQELSTVVGGNQYMSRLSSVDSATQPDDSIEPMNLPEKPTFS